MRNSALFGIGLLVCAAACEQANKTVTAVPSTLRADTSAAIPTVVHPSTQLKPTSAADMLARARADSLRVVAVLAHADSTVEFEEYSTGDLNGDGQWDYLVLTRSRRPIEKLTEDANYGRKVFIVLNAGAAGFRVAAVSENLVGCTDCGGAGVGDPFQSFEAYDKGFKVTQLFGACDKTEYISEFVYDAAQHDWFLESRSESSYSCNDTTATVHENNESPRDFGRVRFSDV